MSIDPKKIKVMVGGHVATAYGGPLKQPVKPAKRDLPLRTGHVGGSGNRGQFAMGKDLDRMCKCGHPFGEHTGARPYSCLVDEGHCMAFRPVKK